MLGRTNTSPLYFAIASFHMPIPLFFNDFFVFTLRPIILYNFLQQCCLIYFYLALLSLFIIMRIFTSLTISLLQFFILTTHYQISSFIVAIILLEIIFFQTNSLYYSCNHALSTLILPFSFSKRIYCLLLSLLYAFNSRIYYSILYWSGR